MAENKQKKAKKWSQKYKTEYSLHYPCIRKSERGNFHAFCTICSVDISVEHGGRDDIRKHVGSKRHTDIAKARSSSSSTLLNYFTKQGTSIYVYIKKYTCKIFLKVFCYKSLKKGTNTQKVPFFLSKKCPFKVKHAPFSSIFKSLKCKILPLTGQKL